MADDLTHHVPASRLSQHFSVQIILIVHNDWLVLSVTRTQCQCLTLSCFSGDKKVPRVQIHGGPSHRPYLSGLWLCSLTPESSCDQQLPILHRKFGISILLANSV